ncbi:MAG: TMAO reductase system sensor histidine kinase/response regulator TorS [Gammaproteobacteria bacterium]|nr:TMAO reductase system sensor histidine kinase/response regulator TorS [Gammaproteobacteria bacterium]
MSWTIRANYYYYQANHYQANYYQSDNYDNSYCDYMVKISITAKLLIAFGAVALLSLFAAGVGIFGFQRISTTQNSVINQAIPVLKDAHALTRINTRIGAFAQRLLDVSDQRQYEETSEQLKQHMISFRQLIDRLVHQEFAVDYLQSINQVFNQINLILGKQNELVAKRLEVQGSMTEMAERLISNTAQLSDLSNSLVANAATTTTAVASSLYDLVEQGTPPYKLYDVFDRLIEVDIDEMERMFELRLRSSNLSSIVSQVVKETEQTEINSLKQKAIEVVSILERRVNEINDPQRKFKAHSLLRSMRLDSGPLNTLNLFKLREQELALQNALAESDQRYRVEASKLNSIVSGLSNSSGSVMELATRKAESSLRESRQLFIFITILALALILLILWRYVHVNVIRRLLSLKEATLAIAGGNLGYRVDNSGKDELSSMADALVLFRDNAREKENLDQELQNHKNNLEKTVNYRTNQLRLSNEKLEKEVAEHAIARQKAEQANRAKTDFMATISHELRTPLSGALGTLNLLHATGLTPKQREYLNAIDTANSVLLDILDNVLGYSQVRAGKIDIEQENFNLHELMHNVVNVMTASAKQRENTMVLELDNTVPVWSKGDSGKLNQILMNLIGNAIKFTQKGTITVTVRKIDFGDDKTKIQFEVIDTGIGVSEEKREEIFMAFTQGDSSTSRRYGGIGLGLAICKSLVDLLDGSISLYSILGEGTTVCLILDFESADNEDLNPMSVNQLGMGAAGALERKIVLLVEDDETNRLVVKHYLESMGHTVVVAEDGHIALKALETQILDVVLLDISLPGADGMAVVKKIRQSEIGLSTRLPVIAMSAHVFNEEVERYLEAGMNGFIGKPFTRDDLALTLSDTLGEVDAAGDVDNVIQSAGSVAQVRENISDTRPDPSKPLEGSPRQSILNQNLIRDDLSYLGRKKVMELVSIYRKNITSDINELRNYMDSEDQEAVTRLAHRMKSGAGNLGFLSLFHLLDDVENGKRKESEVIREIADCSNASIQALDDFVASVTGSQNM